MIDLILIVLLSIAGRGERQHVVTPAELNQHGTAFGGFLLSEMDRASGIAVRRILNDRDAVTIAVNDVRFVAAARQKDLLVTTAYVSETGTKSLTVTVATRRGNETIATGKFVFVSVKDGVSIEHGLPKVKGK